MDSVKAKHSKEYVPYLQIFLTCLVTTDDITIMTPNHVLLFQEDGLFDHAQGNDFSMFDNLDSFLQEFGNSVSEPGLLSPSPALSDSGLSNTSSDQIMSPDDNGDDDLSKWIWLDWCGSCCQCG